MRGGMCDMNTLFKCKHNNNTLIVLSPQKREFQSHSYRNLLSKEMHAHIFCECTQIPPIHGHNHACDHSAFNHDYLNCLTLFFFA